LEHARAPKITHPIALFAALPARRAERMDVLGTLDVE